MATKLTDLSIREAPGPGKGQPHRFLWDGEVKGFGVRLTAGAKAFILDYRTTAGRQRRMTIGSFPDWKTTAARDEAKRLRREVDQGADPMADRAERRDAPTVDELADRFVAEHLSKRRPSTKRDYEGLLRLYIRPALGRTKVADVTHSDIEKLHREVAAKAPYQANRVAAVLSKMFALAIRWGMRADNPVKGVERAPEEKRERFLSPVEVGKLADALAGHPERTSADAIRMLLLTGARRTEVLSMRWDHIDLEKGVWVKPSSHTKQKREHRVPLSAPAMALLAEIRGRVDAACPFVFPSDVMADGEFRHLVEVKKCWLSVCKTAGLGRDVPVLDAKGKPMKDAASKPLMVWQSDVRLHDLRHSYASILASAGLSLPIIGALLGHTQAQTTARYSHLMDDALRAATERVGAVVTSAGKASAEVVPMQKRGT